MQNFQSFIYLIILILLYSVPVLITAFNIINLAIKKKILELCVDILTFVLGIPLTMILFQYWGAKEYTEPIVINGFDIEVHTPVSYKHMPTVIVIAAIAIVGYWVLRIYKDRLPPLVSLLCISSIYSGMTLGILYIVQMSKNIFTVSLIFPSEAVYLILFPLNFILCSIRLIRHVIAAYLTAQNDMKSIYKSNVLNLCYKILSNSIGWYTTAFVMMLPLLGITLVILVIFGQSPDAIIKAFTETSDWTLSQKISPPPVEYEGHYLCTVALNGHKRLVKPTRMGIRHGVKIVVNRQLCIANAFEQLIQEKAPGMHKLIRYIYDRYGYPLSKHITTSLCADVVYIFMKPLEWFFLIVLYLFDVKPENRIALQYTGRTAAQEFK